MKIKLFLIFFLISIFWSCKMGPYYWNAEVLNNGNQVRLINMIFGQSYFYLNLLPAKKCICHNITLLSFSGNVKYIFKNDSSLSVDLFIKNNENKFAEYKAGMREDGKDWIFAYCGIQLGCSYENRIEIESVPLKDIQYFVKGKILLNADDTLNIESQGKLSEGNWRGNWKGK
jgi:hypothetical protein